MLETLANCMFSNIDSLINANWNLLQLTLSLLCLANYQNCFCDCVFSMFQILLFFSLCLDISANLEEIRVTMDKLIYNSREI